jgi:hypothetical protein
MCIAVAARSKACVCRAGLLGLRPGPRVSVMGVVCCQVEVSVSGWSLVQRSPAACGVSK